MRSDDVRGPRMSQRRLGPRFRADIVLYRGAQHLGFGSDLACLPISAPWAADP